MVSRILVPTREVVAHHTCNSAVPTHHRVVATYFLELRDMMYAVARIDGWLLEKTLSYIHRSEG